MPYDLREDVRFRETGSEPGNDGRATCLTRETRGGYENDEMQLDDGESQSFHGGRSVVIHCKLQ